MRLEIFKRTMFPGSRRYTILMRGDKKIRLDIRDPHGDKPHFHLEQQTPSGKWKDAGPQHRYYFKEE